MSVTQLRQFLIRCFQCNFKPKIVDEWSPFSSPPSPSPIPPFPFPVPYPPPSLPSGSLPLPLKRGSGGVTPGKIFEILHCCRWVLAHFEIGLRKIDFYRASNANTVIAVIVCLSIWPSVCPSVTSRSCTKMAKPRITLTMPYDSPETLVFRCQKPWRNSHDITSMGAPNRGGVSSAFFDQYLAISQKWSQIGTYFLRKANRNSYALYRMALFLMTLGDP